MSSLAEVSNLLVEQNTVLAIQADATANTNKNIKKLTDYFTGLDALEKTREASPAIEAPSAPGISEGQGNIDTSRFNIGAMFTPAALLGIAKTFAVRLLRGGLIVALADEIADAIGGEFKGELERALVGFGIGSIFGVKFGLIAGALGALLDEETLAQVTPIIEDIGKAIKDFAAEYLPSLETIQNGIVTGLEGLRNILTGNISKVWEEGQVTETLLLLGGLGAIFAPGKALAAAIATSKLAWTGIIGSVKMLGGLAGLVGGAGAAAATAQGAGQLLTDKRGRQYVSKLGADGKPVADYSKKAISQATRATPALGGSLKSLLPAVATFLTGKVALAALGVTAVAGLGYLATNAFMETDTYKALKKRADDIGKVLDGDVEGTDLTSLEETASFSSMGPLGRFAADSLATLDTSRKRAQYNDRSLAAEISGFANRERAINNNIMNAPVTNASTSVTSNNSINASPSYDINDAVMGGA